MRRAAPTTAPGGSAAGDAASGAVAGLAATVVMSVLMLAAQKAGLMGQQPPKKIAGKTLRRTHAQPGTEQAEDVVSTLTHFAFGGAAGAVYAVARRVLPPRLPPLVSGIGFGLLVWLVSYQGLVPAARIMPPPEKDRPGRPASMVLAHVAYGAVLGRLARP